MEPHERRIQEENTHLDNQFRMNVPTQQSNLPSVPVPMEFTVSTSITPQEKQQMNKNDYERVQAERKRLDERGFIEYTDRPNFGALNMPKNNIYSKTIDKNQNKLLDKNIPKPMLSSVNTDALNKKVPVSMKESISKIDYKKNDYVPEISSKRRLNNILYNNVVNRVRIINPTSNIDNLFNVNHIKLLIKKLGLKKPNNKWTKKDKQKLAKSLKILINKLSKTKKKPRRSTLHNIQKLEFGSSTTSACNLC